MEKGLEVETHNGVVEIKYESDGVLAIPEGTEYSRNDGEFETALSNQVLALEEGTSVYLEQDTDFEAYNFTDFVKMVSEQTGDTSIFDPERTEVYDSGEPGKSSSTPVYPGSPDGSGDTSVFDPSDYEIGDPTEYTKMMKENADTIILELAERGITGEEAIQTLDQLFENMNDTYDRFVYDEETSKKDKDSIQSRKTESSEPSLEGEKRAVQQADKRKLNESDVEEHLSQIEESLDTEAEEREIKDYVDAEKLLTGERQSEIDDFRSVQDELEEGQSEISDF